MERLSTLSMHSSLIQVLNPVGFPTHIAFSVLTDYARLGFLGMKFMYIRHLVSGKLESGH